MRRARTYGSSTCPIRTRSGSLLGFSTSTLEPSVRTTRYFTLGTVVTSWSANSRSKRSCTISMWSSPRKPQRNPNPRAAEVSGSYWRLASLSLSLASASRSSSYWFESVG